MTALTKQNLPLIIKKSIIDFAESTTSQKLKRVKDIRRDKIAAVTSFFTLIEKSPEMVQVSDINEWHQWLLDSGNGRTKAKNQKTRGLEETTIYTRFSHLSAYFEWLRKLPEFAGFLPVNPIRLAMPKPPQKYNSPKAKALTDEELSKLWLYLENLAKDDKNLPAVRDYAIFRLFMATGMRREEVINIGAGDVKIEDNAILLHTRIKGGTYEWRTVTDDEVKTALERYLRLTRRKSVIGREDRALWIRFDRGAKVMNRVFPVIVLISRSSDTPKIAESGIFISINSATLLPGSSRKIREV
jgi:integrase